MLVQMRRMTVSLIRTAPWVWRMRVNKGIPEMLERETAFNALLGKWDEGTGAISSFPKSQQIT